MLSGFYKYISCLILAVVTSVSVHVFAQGGLSTPFLFSQNLSSPYVSSFAEDKDGFMWIGTNHGLNRYNGSFYDVHYSGTIKWAREAYKDMECMNNDNVQKVLVDEVGDIWILSEAGFSVRRNGQFYHFGKSGFNPLSYLVDFDRDYIIAAGVRGIDKVRKSDLTVAYHYKSVVGGKPKPIGVSGNGCVLVTRSIDDADYIVLLDEQMREVGSVYFPVKSHVNDIIRDKDGSNWIVTDRQIYNFNAESFVGPTKTYSGQMSFTLDNMLFDPSHDTKLLFVCDYDDDNLLVGLQNEGFELVEKKVGRRRPIHESETLPFDHYTCFVDSHHNIWLTDGINGYIFLPSDMDYMHLSFAHSKDASFKSLCVDAHGRLWLRSSGDLVCFCPSTHRYVSFAEDGAFYADMFIDSHDRIWTIENYTHIKCYEIAEDAGNKVGVKLNIARHYRTDASAFTISEDACGRIWISLAEKLAVIDEDGVMSYKEGPFRANIIQIKSYGEKHRMFVHTAGKGIFELTGNDHFNPIDIQVPGARVVYADDKGNLWIGSSYKGLVRFDEKTREAEYIMNKMEVSAYDVKTIEEDSWGNIWFSTSTVIFRYNIADSTVVSIHDDHMRDGTVYNLGALAKDRQGKLYFGGMAGVTEIDPMELKFRKKEIDIKLENVIIGGRTLYEYDGKPFELNYSDNNLVFWFSGLVFSLGKTLSYEYKLDGYDKRWLPVGHQTRISYSNLPAADYKLQIRVTSIPGSCFTGSLEVPFSIKPALWCTVWAKLLYIIILIAIVYFAIRIIVRWRLREERYTMLQQRETINSQFVKAIKEITSFKDGKEDELLNKKGNLLVVEDNQEICRLIQICLGKKYNLHYSSSIIEAWDILGIYLPDMIISDTEMPEKEGFAYCRKVKDSLTYGHIPVMLLTADPDISESEDYVGSGAEAYLPKPFDPRVLVSLVEKIIAHKRDLQKRLSSLSSVQVGVEPELSEAEQNFLKQFYSVIDEHLADGSFGIEEMSKALGISEAKLYARVKSLTGQTPKAFLVTYRMNKAMELLKTGKYNVSEVGYMVGASSLATFSRGFKHQFGIAPSTVTV